MVPRRILILDGLSASAKFRERRQRTRVAQNQSGTASERPTASNRISRGETRWLGFAIIAGAVLRLGTLNQVAVEQFDEAVYASNLLFPADAGGEYPLRQLYAPPLLPAAIEGTMIVGQLATGDVPSWWPMLPSLIAGLATIPSAWWIARSWFTPTAGVVAALVIAFHEYHASYSRAALTDVPMALFLLWAVHWFWIALQTGRTRDAMLAGGWTALAWWTKYNGWLPLAIAAAGGVFWQMLLSREQRRWTQLARVWGIAAVTAVALWSPVLWDCRKVGGYARIAENHRGYFTGLSRWGANLWTGFGMFDEFVGWLSLVGLVLAGVVVFLDRKKASRGEQRPILRVDSTLLALSLVGAWFVGLFVATPMYHPYSRLWVPFHVATALVFAALVTQGELRALALRGAKAGAESPTMLSRWYCRLLGVCAAGCALLLILAASPWRSSPDMPSFFESRTGLRDAARQIRERIGSDGVCFVAAGDPALWYHLRQMGSPATLTDSFESARHLHEPVYIVVGPMSARDPHVQKERDREREDRVEIVRISLRLSRIALLDLFTPDQLAADPKRRGLTVELEQVAP
jgi:4-amino-4-deoxy-L-arabinose transferase-like glycosyltransferase